MDSAIQPMDCPDPAWAGLSGLDLEEVCTRLSQAIQPFLSHEWMRVCLAPQHERHLQVRFAIFKGEIATARSALPLNESLPGSVVLSGQPVHREDLVDEALFEDEKLLLEEHGLRSILVIPLVSSGRPIGALDIASLRPSAYASLALETLERLARSASAVVEHGWRMDESREIARINERRRLAWELHDGFIQSLTGFVLQLDLAERYLQSDVPRARQEIRRARDDASACLEDARQLVLNLRPRLPGRSTLCAAVAREFGSLRATGVEVDFTVDGEERPTDPDVETALYRFAQETAANIRKHARPTRVVATLVYRPDSVKFAVLDDGAGFDCSTLFRAGEQYGYSGLASARDRLRQVGGGFHIESAPDRGTAVVAEVPCNTPSREAARIEEGKSGPRIRVLLADRHAMFRQSMRHLLEQASDIEVVDEADNSDAVIEKVKVLRPDVVIVDAQLPETGGIELVSVLSRSASGSRYLVVSADGGAEIVFRAVKAGAHGYLLKEVAGSVLIESVRSLQRGEMVLHPIERDQPEARYLSDRLLFPQQLTRREGEVLRLIALGLRNKEIARRLSLTENTVKHHVASLLGKLDADSRTEALINAQKLGLIAG